VRSKLASIPGIQVTARASTSQYKKSTKTPAQIGKELDVDYLLTGTVRWSKTAASSRVRVNPELIQVNSSANKWSEGFEAELSDVFKVQSDIAGKVASALDVALGESAQKQLEAENPTAIRHLIDLAYQEELSVEPAAVDTKVGHHDLPILFSAMSFGSVWGPSRRRRRPGARHLLRVSVLAYPAERKG
jgi:glutamate synthase domain-containing protein 2